MTPELDGLADRITEALRIVIDPELGHNIVDLGLVYDVNVTDGGVVGILMTTTTSGCPATTFLQEGVREGASAVPGVESVEVTLTYDPHWNPDMMTEDAKRHLGFA
jgi:metal-sulfur cluster biosynthetic enzyme